MRPIAPAGDSTSGVEPALDIDHGSEQRRVEVVVPGMCANDVLVLERIADAEIDIRLRLDEPRRHCRHGQDGDSYWGEEPHGTRSSEPKRPPRYTL
jgi:hypothetical protein